MFKASVTQTQGLPGHQPVTNQSPTDFILEKRVSFHFLSGAAVSVNERCKVLFSEERSVL